MEEILKQHFEYAQITLVKNYSPICYKEIIKGSSEIHSTPLGTMDMTVQPYIPKSSAYIDNDISFIKFPTKKTGRNFFYDQNGIDDPNKIEAVPFITLKVLHNELSLPHNLRYHNYSFETTKEKHIRYYYNNPFAHIEIHKLERRIKKDGNKITVKFYKQRRERYINNRYFVRNIESLTITFDIEKGNFRIIKYDKKIGKKPIKSFYTNSCWSLKEALTSIYCSENQISSSSSFRNEYLKEFDNGLFDYALKKTLNIDGKDNIGKVTSFRNGRPFAEIIMLDWTYKFIELKKIKLPDHGYFSLITRFYPTEKYLKKNDRKLVAAVLDNFRIKSKITIKLLHQNPLISIFILAKTCYIFGQDYAKYIGNIHPDFFTAKSEGTDMFSGTYQKRQLLNSCKQPFIIKNKEKENIFKIINDYIQRIPKGNQSALSTHYTGEDLIEMIYDHFHMLEKIREYYPDMELTARTYGQFHLEHAEFAKIEREIRKGWSIEYTFDKNLIDEIEKPIEIQYMNPINKKDIEHSTQNENVLIPIKKLIFYPKILKNTEDYFEEGSYMHHCVAGYIDSKNSMIISLRLSDERVTCEFDMRTRTCLQERYFCNTNPPDHYLKPLEELRIRIRTYSYNIEHINEIKRKLEINGKEVDVVEDPFGF